MLRLTQIGKENGTNERRNDADRVEIILKRLFIRRDFDLRHQERENVERILKGRERYTEIDPICL